MNAFITNFGSEPAPGPAAHHFRIEPHDRVTIEGKPYRFLRKSGENVELMAIDGPGLVEQFPLSRLGRLSAEEKIRHDVGYYLPDDLKATPEVKNAEFRVSELPPAARERFHTRHALVRATLDLIEAGRIRNNTADINAHISEIATTAAAYHLEEASERDLLKHEMAHKRLPASVARTTNRGKGGVSKAAIEPFSADHLRKLVTAYRKWGPAALADSFGRSGNRTSPFCPEEQALMMETIKLSYLTPERKPVKATVIDVQRAFGAENGRRAEQGLWLLRVPGKDAVRSAIAALDRFKVMVLRFGIQHAMKTLRPVREGLTVARPGERVEIDEWCIDLMSIIHSAKLQAVFGEEFLEAVGLDNTKDRWWLVAAIDCRTRVILGMKLARSPSASAARECLRMIVSDKGQWADAVGALAPWSHVVVPETLVTDNGSGFKSTVFSDACLDLKIAAVRTIAGIPGMRGTIERLFRTSALDLMPRLKGRTFSNPLERGDYKAEDRACLDAEGLAFALVRWVVDIYHNAPHQGLGGRTPLEQWEADMKDGNYPVRALPDARARRLAFGMKLTRTVSKSGITIMGIRYHSADLVASSLAPGSRQVDVRWDTEDLGAIEVFLDGAWREVRAVHEQYDGVNLHVWVRARRALRAKSAQRKVWEEDVVFKAIGAIEDLVQDRSAAMGIVDMSISEAHFKHLEATLFATFETVPAERLQADAMGLGRVIAPKAPDADAAPRAAGPAMPSPLVTEAPDLAAAGADTYEPLPAAPFAPKPATRHLKFGLPIDPKEGR